MKPNGREEWRIILELLRMLRVFSPSQRQQLYCYGKKIENSRQ